MHLPTLSCQISWNLLFFHSPEIWIIYRQNREPSILISFCSFYVQCSSLKCCTPWLAQLAKCWWFANVSFCFSISIVTITPFPNIEFATTSHSITWILFSTPTRWIQWRIQWKNDCYPYKHVEFWYFGCKMSTKCSNWFIL